MRKPGVQSLVVAGIVVVLFTGSAAGDDRNNLLRGDYAFSGEATCLGSSLSASPPGGFHEDLTPVTPPFPFVFSYSIQGVRTFNGDGTGKVVGRTVSFSHPYALPSNPAYFNPGGASSSDIEADFTYEVAPDRTLTIDQPLSLGTVLTGTRTGQTFKLENVRFVGLMPRDGKILTIASGEPTVETHTFFAGNAPVFVRAQICHRARMLFKLR